MIALTISDTHDAESAIRRIAELKKRNKELNVPDAICIRNDSFSPEMFASITELVSKVWDGKILLETDDPLCVGKAALSVIDRKPILVGANGINLEQFCMMATMFGCPLCVSDEKLETVFELAEKAKSLGIEDVIIDPMMRNMKQCLETCTDIKRILETVPEMHYSVAVRTWSGEYAMTMATVSLLIDDSVVIVDDLDYDCCDTLSALISSVR